ncbi:hypothetical protein RSO01_86950 [Reyranella soli]|uniref:Uncharacterized protein n=1 Tax=Reyranella soli TaxID=1230389 RepID=A0A512NRG5_9HYPH|nr:hypothetical protein RSO01_86950 [Reyranella soli]
MLRFPGVWAGLDMSGPPTVEQAISLYASLMEGRQPKGIGGGVVWDIRRLDIAFDAQTWAAVTVTPWA